MTIWNWYSADGILTGSDYAAKFFLARARLFRSPFRAAAFATAVENQTAITAETTLRDFIQHLDSRSSLESRAR